MPTTKTETTNEVHESFIDENGIPQQRNGSGPVVDLKVLSLWQGYKNNPQDDQLRNQLLENYLPVVKVHAERLWHRLPDGVELDDLFSAGCFGMLNAIGSFDLSRGIKFEAYCVTRVRGAMLDELRHMDWVPRMVRTQATKLYNATNELEAKLGRHPTEEELAAHMDLPMPELEKIMATSSSINLISLDKKKWQNSEGNKSMSEMDIVADKRFASPNNRMCKNDVVRLVTKGLSRAERLIMILYYFEEMTMKEIGATLDLSESRVSQIHSNIVLRLRSQLETRKGEFKF
ncbi:MAG: FliA/WhiG family RNA polymerase sigma factor [Planctomycetota bacterium]|nr:FliA/WhiG family RNA polymerase sigma factor [Planctomycetota bacterium]